MKWIYEFAAAFFFAAAGYLAADAVPDKTVGAIVGVCLLLVGAVLLAAGLQGLLKKLEECRAAEKEQAEKRAAELKAAVEILQEKLQTLCENTAAMQATLTAEHTAATKYYETQSVQEKTLHDDLLKKMEECRAAEKEQAEKRAAALKTAAEIQQEKLQTLCENTAAMQATLTAEHTAATKYYETQPMQEKTMHDDLLKKLENRWGTQDKTAGTIYKACLELQNNVKKLCESTTKNMGAVQSALVDSAGDQKKAIRDLCTDMKECLGEARDFMGEQQGQFTGALHQENEDNRTKLDRILQNYAQLTAQDLDVLRALGLGVEDNDG